MLLPYPFAKLVATADATSDGGVRLVMERYTCTTGTDKDQATRGGWIVSTRYDVASGALLGTRCEQYSGGRLHRLDHEWREAVRTLREAGEVSLAWCCAHDFPYTQRVKDARPVPFGTAADVLCPLNRCNTPRPGTPSG